MASSSPTIDTAAAQPLEQSPRGVGKFGASGLSRWLWPSFFDFVVVSLPIWFFGLADGGTGLLLSDGDAGWHIRTGDWILQHMSFVRQDIFSFTKPGQPWFAWEWLSDVVLSSLHSAMGMKGVLMYGIVMATLFCGLIFRHMVWRGANVFIALPLALLGFGSSTVHLLARPHLWTMVLVAACAWLIQRDLRRHTRWIWALIPLTVVWTNLHGGWLALVAILGIVSAGSAVETLLGQSSLITVRRYAFLAAACLAASLINPFTWHLHAHMAEYLTVDWIKDLIGEFKSPTFRAENMKQYELILLVSIAASGAALLRRNFVGPLLVLFWAHSSLVSARHIPLFVAISLPFLAEELTRLWTSWTATAKKSSVPGILGALAAESQAGIGRASVWAVLPFIVVASPLLALPWPKDFPPSRFPIKMVEKHAELLVRSRVYAEDQWADYLIYRLSPRQKVFFDGRSDFYGEQISREYCMLMNGTHRWKELMAKYDFNAVLIRPDWPLASLLKEQPGWRVVDDDTKAILFERLPTTPSQPNSTR